MKHRNMFLKYMSPMSEGGDGGSTTETTPTQSEQAPEQSQAETPPSDAVVSPEGAKQTEGEVEASEQSQSQEEGEKTDQSESGEGEQLSQREADLVKEVMKKKGKIGELTEQLNQFKGVDLEKYQAFLAKEQEALTAEKLAEEQRLVSEGKVEELLALRDQENKGAISQIVEQHKVAMAASESAKAALEAEVATLRSTIEELTVGSAFNGSELIRNKLVSAFTPERTRKLYGEHFDIVDGKIVGYDKPRTDTSRVKLVDSEGNAAGFEDALARIIQSGGDANAMFRSSAKQGVGSYSLNESQYTPTATIGEGVDRITAALNKAK